MQAREEKSMNEVKSVGGVLISLVPKSQPVIFKSRARFRVLLRRLGKRVMVAWRSWNLRWHEQVLRAAEIERARLKEQARLHERIPMTRWHGHY